MERRHPNDEYTGLARRELEPAASPRLALFDLLLARGAALAIRHAAASELIVLEARREMAAARMATEDAERELRRCRHLYCVPPAEAQQVLREENETERLLLERKQIRDARFGRGALPPPAAQAPARAGLAFPAASPAAELALNDRQIERLAQNSAAHARDLPSGEAERFWAEWQAELERRFPAFAATEIARRAAELRGLLR